MSEDEIGRLAYLVLLVTVVGGYFIVSQRDRLGLLMRQATLWGLIFVGAVAAIGLWGDIRHDVIPRQSQFEGGRIEVPVARDGHFYLTADLNGTPVRFVVDTGASDMVLTRRDAERIGIDTQSLVFLGTASTANGLVETAPVRIATVDLGGAEDSNVRAVVNGGALDTSLLGMGYLNRFDRIELTRDRLILQR